MEAYPLFQMERRGSIPTSSLHFEKCTLYDVSWFIKKYHYSHTHPGGIDFCFRLFYDNKIAGVCVFGYMAGNPNAVPIKGYHPSYFRELMRLVLLDEVPKNSESKFIAWCLRYLKECTNLIACISFADPKYGHTGIIYKASNWQYLGLQKPDRPRLFINGEEIHPRMAFDKFGTSSIEEIKKKGYSVTTEDREPKHKFLYLLKK